MKKLTEKQKQILKLIAKKVRDFGFPPTVQELADALGFKSKNAAFKHLEALERKGYIRRTEGGARGITILQHDGLLDEHNQMNVPLLGVISAGSPLLAQENIDRYISVPDYLTKPGGAYFALRVQGDSMVDAGIFEGDLVIVRQTNEAINGDIVVAFSDYEATVKRFIARGNHKYLKPENPRYANIPLSEDWSIQGKVVALIRDHV